MNFIPLLQAEAAQGGSSFITIGMFALIFVIFYLFIIRPQNKKQKEMEKMINSVKKGDRVITIGGMHGEVSAVREKTFVLKVEDGSRIEFNRAAISSVVNKDEEKAEKPEKTGRTGKSAKPAGKEEEAEVSSEMPPAAEGKAQKESADSPGSSE